MKAACLKTNERFISIFNFMSKNIKLEYPRYKRWDANLHMTQDIQEMSGGKLSCEIKFKQKHEPIGVRQQIPYLL